MKKKKPEVGCHMSEVREKADQYLASLEKCCTDIALIQADLEKQLQQIRDIYAGDIAILNELKSMHEKDLKKFAKKNKADLFGESDKVSLSHGIIIYSETDKVSIPRDAVERIEALGWEDGIKIEKNIDRPVIDKWSDEKLAAIGATKKPKKEVSWELKKQSAEGRAHGVKA